MTETSPWQILVVDDEEGIHSITRMIFRGYEFENRPLELISARSGSEARQLLQQYPLISVALLDVVMETDDEGLKLVEYIRHDLENHSMRLILRTGHPGFAPETDVIVRYDINDYLSKADLSASRLLTSVLVALRGFRDIQQARLAAPLVTEHTDNLLTLLTKPLLAQQQQLIERLLQLALSPMVQDQVHQLNSNLQQLLMLHLDAESFSTDENEPCSIDTLLQQLLNDWLPLSRQQQRLVDLRYDTELPESLLLNKAATKQLYSLLLGHALLGTQSENLIINIGYQTEQGQLVFSMKTEGEQARPLSEEYRSLWQSKIKPLCDKASRQLGGSLLLLEDSPHKLQLQLSMAASVA